MKPCSQTAQMFKELCQELGVMLWLEPNDEFSGRLVFSNGQVRIFRGTHLDINPLGAAEVVKHKEYATRMMEMLGYPVILGKVFYSDECCRKARYFEKDANAARQYVTEVGLPVVVKPNSGSQGNRVNKACNMAEFDSALQSVFEVDSVALVQECVHGVDCRLLVLDDEVMAAYTRKPLSVTGNSVDSIEDLLAAKLRQLQMAGRMLSLDPSDRRIAKIIERRNLSWSSCLNDGEEIALLDNANLSTGGELRDITDEISEFYKEIACRLVREMGLRYCGVDFMIDGDVTEKNRFWIIELNAAPGMDNFGSLGEEQMIKVREIHRKLLIAMKRL